MHKLIELKEMLCRELEEYGSKDKLDMGGLEIVDKLAHAVKNIDKILEAYEGEEYSSQGSSRRGSSRRGSYEGGSYDGGSSRRGGSSRMGSSYGASYENSYKRDSRGRYSRDGEEIVEELRGMMQDADPQMRQELQRIVQKMESM